MDELVLQDSQSVGHGIQEFPQLKSKDGIERLREEMDQYLERMQSFGDMEIDGVFQHLSAFSARATELKIQLSRTESAKATAFRNRELEPFLVECDRQFKLYSRMTTTKDLEFRISGGQT